MSIVIASDSDAIHSNEGRAGLLRRFAPRNDGDDDNSTFHRHARHRVARMRARWQAPVGIQYAASFQFLTSVSEYWMVRLRGR
jgi:hypothetical protein